MIHWKSLISSNTSELKEIKEVSHMESTAGMQSQERGKEVRPSGGRFQGFKADQMIQTFIWDVSFN